MSLLRRQSDILVKEVPMRLFLSALVTALIVPFAAQAQAPKQVEVINDPLAVEVTTPIAIVEPVAVEITEPLAVEVVNPAPPNPPVRFQLVGFTSAAFLGDVGLFVFSRACHAEFSDSRMCLSEEILKTVQIPDGLAGDAWIQASIFAGGGSVNAAVPFMVDASGVGGTSSRINCSSAGSQSWSSTSGGGLIVDFEGRISSVACADAHSIACCALVP
jgi:hypothetical protein